MMDKFDIRGEYSSIHSHFPASTPSPVIGITANYRDNNAMVAEAYYLSLLEAGGTPMIIPPYANRNALMETLRHVDALLLTGGADIDPRYMGQEPDYTLLHSINPKRDEQELLLVRLAVDMNIPILGICRGMQVLAAALGGDVHQDIYAALGDGLLNHDQEPAERHVATHDVRISNDTLLRRIFSCDEHYFDVIDTPNKAYILGLLWSDGYNDVVRGQIKIQLQDRDKSVLERINIEVDSDRPLWMVQLHNKNSHLSF